MANPADDLFADLLPSARPQRPQSSPADELFADLLQQQQPEQVGVIRDVGKGVGAGLVKGTMGLVALPGIVEQLGRMGINKLGGGVSPEPALPTYQDIKGSVERRTGMALYEPKTKAGQYASTVAEFLPGMLFPAGGAATTLAGRVGQRALFNVIAPGVVSETAGQLTKGTSAEPYARMAGGIVGGMAPAIAGRIISPGAINTTTPAGAERARNVGILQSEGVPLTAGDVTGSRPLRWAESVARDTMGSQKKANQLYTDRAEGFTRAQLSRVGEDAPLATQEVVNRAYVRVGKDYEDVAARVAVPLNSTAAVYQPTGQNVVQQVRAIADDLAETTAEAMTTKLPSKIADNLEKMAATNTHMDGKTYLRWRSQLGAAASGSQDTYVKNSIYQLQNALDDTVERYMQAANRPDMVEKFQKAREQYRNLLVISKARRGAGEDIANGLLSPSAVRNAAATVHGEANFARGRGSFAELSNAGEAIFKSLPQSGTAPRQNVMNLVSLVGAVGGTAAAGPAGVFAGLAPMALQGLAMRSMVSDPMQRYLRNQVAVPLVNMPRGRMRAAIPGTIVQGND